MANRQLIGPGCGAGFTIARGQRLRVIDPEGGQSGDLVAYSSDGRQRLSNGSTFDCTGKVYLTTGDVLWSSSRSPMFTIVSDDVGRHDFLYAPCSIEMYRSEYGITGHHANCHDNLRAAFQSMGIDLPFVPTAFNVFMNVDVTDTGALAIKPPRSRAGDSLVLRAEMDMKVALTTCPASNCNGGGPTRPLAYQVLD